MLGKCLEYMKHTENVLPRALLLSLEVARHLAVGWGWRIGIGEPSRGWKGV